MTTRALDVPLTALSEVNVMMTRSMYNLFRCLQPSRWTSPDQVIYYPVEDRESHFRHFEELRQTSQVLIPFAAITRSSEIVLPTGAQDAFRYEETFGGAVKGKPVQLEYVVNVFEERQIHLENMINQFVLHLYTSGQLTMEFRSRVLGGVVNQISLDFQELPQFGEVPGHSELREGAGAVYSITMNVRAYTMLGEVSPEDNLIAKIRSSLDLLDLPADRERDVSLFADTDVLHGLVLIGDVVTDDTYTNREFGYRSLLLERREWVASNSSPDIRFVAAGRAYRLYRVLATDEGVCIVVTDEESGETLADFPVGVGEFWLGDLRLRVDEGELKDGGGYLWAGEQIPADGGVIVQVLGSLVRERRRLLGRYMLDVESPAVVRGFSALEQTSDYELASVQYDVSNGEFSVQFASEIDEAGLLGVWLNGHLLHLDRSVGFAGNGYRWVLPSFEFE